MSTFQEDTKMRPFADDCPERESQEEEDIAPPMGLVPLGDETEIEIVPPAFPGRRVVGDKIIYAQSKDNGLIHAERMEDKVIITIVRECLNKIDVRMCLQVFVAILEDVKLTEQVRVMVDTSALVITPDQIKVAIVWQFVWHFQKQFTRYKQAIKRCAVQLALTKQTTQMVKKLSGFMKLITLGDKSLLFLTANEKEAKDFLRDGILPEKPKGSKQIFLSKLNPFINCGKNEGNAAVLQAK